MAYEPLNLQNGHLMTAEDVQHMEQGILLAGGGSQADWNEGDVESAAFIKNRPFGTPSGSIDFSYYPDNTYDGFSFSRCGFPSDGIQLAPSVQYCFLDLSRFFRFSVVAKSGYLG